MGLLFHFKRRYYPENCFLLRGKAIQTFLPLCEKVTDFQGSKYHVEGFSLKN